MLRHTFCHLPGVGAKTELRLWAAGVTSWEAARGQAGQRPAPVPRRLGTALLDESARRHADRDAAWFDHHLPASHSWRLFHDFRDSCAYLDIETTGMSWGDQVTSIALYDGRHVRTYVQGANLDDFVRDVRSYRLLVTFNGKSFDVPFLERALNIQLDHAHVDLRHVLKGMGLSGGLKNCERLVGIDRPGLEGVDGFAAVLLWHDYRRRRDRRSLETLLAYNVQDAINLEALMVYAHNGRLADLAHVPFAAGYRLALPAPPANPFRPDPDTLRRVLRAVSWGDQPTLPGR